MLSNKNKCERILFLSRVSPNDCIDVEKALEDKLLENISEEIEIHIESTYDTISSNFTDLKSWKLSTNILCWYCDGQFDTIPIFCPEYKYENPPGNISLKVLGNFCTFSCAAKYNSIYASSGEERWRRDKLLIELYKIFYNEDISRIPLAPRRTDMIQWGGFLTREQYEDTIALSMSSFKKIIQNNSIASIEVNKIT